MSLNNLSEDQDLKQFRYNTEQVLGAGNRAKELVKQILTFSRQVEQAKKPVQIAPIIKEAMKLLRASIGANIEITEDIEKNPPNIMADPTQIHQVLMNLGTNAMQAMHEQGGKLNIVLEQTQLRLEDTLFYPELEPGNFLKLSVSDTGSGMDQETLERIFEPYFTTKNPIEGGSSQGTGLGLAVTLGIVNSHGGIIKVYSEIGHGTTFLVLLPIISKLLEEPDIASAKHELPRGSEHILFVDDEEAIVEIGKKQLEFLGYRVHAERDPEKALELFKANPDQFDLVLTDMTMPHMNGDVLAQNIKQIRDIPIILATGFSTMVNPEKSKDMGISEFIMKPIAMVDLADIVRKVLDK